MRRPATVLGVTLAGAAAAVAMLFYPPSPTPEPGTQVPTTTARPANGQPTRFDGPPSVEAEVPAHENLPASFDGTEADGAVRIDNKGRVIPTRDLRALFDYYLSGVGAYAEDDPVAAVKARLRAYARTRDLPPATRRHLLALFDRYMAYRKAAADRQAQRESPDMARTLRELSEMRIAYLGVAMAEAFYGEQMRHTRAALARRRGEAGSESLSDAQRGAMAPVQLARKTRSLRENGADAAEIQAARRQAVGPAATQRLERLDAQRAAWQEKLDAYRRERAGIMASGMAESDREDAVQALRQRTFSDRQIRRVEALDRLAARRANESRPPPGEN